MDNQSGSECPRRRRLRYTASLFYFIYGCCFEREELRFFFEFRRRVNALAKREGKKTKNEEASHFRARLSSGLRSPTDLVKS